jgi:hypothetical protein
VQKIISKAQKKTADGQADDDTSSDDEIPEGGVAAGNSLAAQGVIDKALDGASSATLKVKNLAAEAVVTQTKVTKKIETEITRLNLNLKGS